MTELFKCEDFHVNYLPGNSNYIIIAFSPVNVYANGEHKIWGERFFIKHGIAAIGITATRPNWFPSRHMPSAAQKILDFIAPMGKPLIGYGHSMGGYATLKYGSLLQLDGAISLSPQTSIATDQRYMKFYDSILNINMNIETSDIAKFSIIIYDSLLQSDRLHADKFRNLENVDYIVMPGAGHMTISYFIRDNLIIDLFYAVLNRKSDQIGSARRHIREKLHSNIDYFYNILTYLINNNTNKTGWIARVREKLEEFGSTSDATNLIVARNLLEMQNFPAAHQLVSSIKNYDTVSFNDLMMIRNIYAHLNHFDMAIFLSEIMLQNHPNRADCWLAYGYYLEKIGRSPFALAAMLRALEAQSMDKNVWIKLAQAFRTLKLPHREAEAIQMIREFYPDFDTN